MILNYAILLEFLNDQNVQGQEVAEWLGTVPETISRIKNNNKNMIKGIAPENFYINVFCKKDSLKDYQGIKCLYSFLESKDCITDYIHNEYLNYEKKYKIDSSSAAKDFLMTILRETSYNKNKDASESKKANQLISAVQESTATSIRFNKFKNPIQNNTFFGRKKMFDDIRRILEEEGTCIVYGIGGLGKSYCSLKYALEYANDYSQIQQVIFSTDIKSTLLKIPFNGLDESHLTEDEILEKRFSILATFSEDTLLIIDNMDIMPADKDNYERLKQLSMHVIFTTRETQIDASKFQLPIEPLSKEEQLELFTHYGQFNITPEDLPAYYNLFEMVQGHTLLLELIAKTMAAETLTPEEMTAILYSPEDDDISKIPIEKDNQYQQEKMNKFVSKLFDTSKLSDPQKEILMKLSLTSISGIRQRLFKQLLSCDNSNINALISQSWIIQNRPGSADSFKIHLHPVIRSAVVNNTEPAIENCHSFTYKIVSLLKEAQNSISICDKTDLCDIIANSSDMFSFGIKDIDLLFDMAQILWGNFFYTYAYKVYLIGISILKEL
ncbi:NB-ARC domain-containing protein [Novisyntrophococcus fermenticellae]|uniref:NB-ARC domain-containing protein n=1 Tax=Novisyntrophococcus fermenticellae TaxID=2068655 RepID=UPI001E2D62DF|nr:NB-ARC domain-containing protein [Novisyntrophococcus fermenticellae]